MYSTKLQFLMLLATIVIVIFGFLCGLQSKVFNVPNPTLSTEEELSELQVQVNTIFDQINKMVPADLDNHEDNTTCAHCSRVTIINEREEYCIGDVLIVQVDMYDYLKKRKTYGGDLLKARISSPDLGAAASGKVEDFSNGTYHIHFTLFWGGKVIVSVILIHPSEVVSALWKARNNWYGYISYYGKFAKPNQETETKCGFERDYSKELCEYADPRDEEYFYCVKPSNFSCDSFTETLSIFTMQSNVNTRTRKLLGKSYIRVEIPKSFADITVGNCSKNFILTQRCKIGMELKYPSGYFMKNIWTPYDCSMQTYHSVEELNSCLKGKIIYIFGDSTLLQWMKYFQSQLKTLKLIDLYENGWAKKQLVIDLERNIIVQWKRHTSPFISSSYQSNKEERTITREIDLIGGHQHNVIVVNIGVHFRAHPLHLYIRRLINIRRALERLFIRSPQTKVIVKSEHCGDQEGYYESQNTFHGYVQYLIMEQVFKGLNVGFVNGWDMTNAFDSDIIHPPLSYIQSEVDMLMTYIC